jgi:hypothetical protein
VRPALAVSGTTVEGIDEPRSFDISKVMEIEKLAGSVRERALPGV